MFIKQKTVAAILITATAHLKTNSYTNSRTTIIAASPLR